MPSSPWFRTGIWCILRSLIGCLAVAGSSVAAESGPVVAGLPEDLLPGLRPILQTAVSRSPEAIRRSIDVDSAEARKIFGRSVLLPYARGSARFANEDQSVSENARASSNTSGFFYDFSINQPIYHWGALRAQADRDKIGLKMAERQTAEAYRLLVLEIRRSYLDLVVKKGALRSYRYQLSLDEGTVETRKARLKAGTAHAGEVAVAELLVEQRKLDIDRAQAAYEAAKRSLIRLSGIETLDDDSIPIDVARPAHEAAVGETILRGFSQGGVKSTFQAEVLQLAMQQTDKDFLIAKHRLYPKFSIFAGYEVRSEIQAAATAINVYAVASKRVGVQAEWSIFDGFATKGSKLMALANKRGIERQLQSYVDGAVDLARGLNQQLAFAARGLDIAERRVPGSRDVLKQTQEELAAGRASPADVDRAKAGVLDAEASVLPARAEYLNRWAEFVSLVGADPAMNNLPARYVR